MMVVVRLAVAERRDIIAVVSLDVAEQIQLKLE